MFECKKLERHGNGEHLGNSSYVQAEAEIELGVLQIPHQFLRKLGHGVSSKSYPKLKQEDWTFVHPHRKNLWLSLGRGHTLGKAAFCTPGGRDSRCEPSVVSTQQAGGRGHSVLKWVWAASIAPLSPDWL